ncbi:MAG: CPBP family intramembrane metalloprotease, partial [Bacteroidetes bacterium]
FLGFLFNTGRWGGTLIVSVLLVAYWGHKLSLDWRGKKSFSEWQKDQQERKKNKDFKPKEKKPYRPNWYYFGFQVLEGFIWGSLLIMLLPDLTFLLIQAPKPDMSPPIPLDSSSSLFSYHTNVLMNISLAFGSGFYEEFIFRGLIFGGIGLAAKQVPFFKEMDAETTSVGEMPFKIFKYKPKDAKFLLAITFTTALYAVSHYLMPFGDNFHVYSFVYRFFFGLLMYYIFVRRSFAVVAWTHCFYDLWYFILS